ncbi:MAG: Bax inhibitor-1/YccA family protein [Firmicutes bacterium]|nr:Bax inhibitor-1/YccA family protein [Bacillota bacterium]
MRYRSSNPVFRKSFETSSTIDGAVTYTNVGIRTILLLLVAGAVGVYTYINLETLFSWGFLIAALIIGFVSVIIGTRSVNLSPVFSIVYAISEGYVLGFISRLYSLEFEGIIQTAVATTFIVLLITMLMYSSGIVKVTKRFVSFLVIGLISVIVMSLIGLLIPSLSGSNFYYLIVGFSAILSVLFLFFDFENIKTCVESGTDRKYSWVLALGLMVTLVWIYLEILRLLAIFSRRR